jgi:PKD repeat protein
LEVAFTDETTGDVTAWAWDFGDGNTSADRDPVHVYAAAGTYDVRLVATGPGGADTLTAAAYVTVDEPVAAAVGISASTGTAPLEVAFTDLSTGDPDTWAWDFGDGAVDTVQNPVHTYVTAGTYTVTLVATGACGPDTLVATDVVTVDAPPAPVAGIAGDPAEGCAPFELAFIDASSGDITSWAWDFGDGGGSTEQNPAHTYAAAGVYTVALTVTGPGGQDTLTLPDHVTVRAPVVAGFTHAEDTGLAPFTVDFADESTGDPVSWWWDFGDGATDTVPDPSHTYTTQDTFTVTLVVGNGCSLDTLVVADAVKVVGVSATPDLQPVAWRLGQNVPNPFNPMTAIWFETPVRATVDLRIYDVSGRLVRTLIGGETRGPGRHESLWDGRADTGRQVPAGVYFYHLRAGDFSATKRMTLVK